MPTLTRWHIRTAFCCFLATLVLGVLLALNEVVALPTFLGATFLGAMGPVYFHLLMVGWVTQLIFGVAFWLFPKKSTAQPRGNERLAWATFGMLNGGLLIRIVAEPLTILQPSLLASVLVIVATALQWGAGVGFVVNTWNRVGSK